MSNFFKRLFKGKDKKKDPNRVLSRAEMYDVYTEEIIKRVCNPNSNCLDIGAHAGEILDIILRHAPKGTHYGFEPIPTFFENLVKKYRKKKNCRFFDLALSDQKGTATFNYVVTNPAYSGLNKRSYPSENENINLIEVKTDLLDNVLPPDYRVDIIKIDVEGGELAVLKGAVKTLKKYKPVIVFEHGLGAAEFYGTTPEMVYELLENCGLKLFTLQGWLNGGSALSQEEHRRIFNTNEEYYFVAAVNNGSSWPEKN
ncbi:FkbM family methyltransferase [Chitinophaga polysaccharea]|uniref:FkbM family methyltransferase n=1 Tax=Chitinophaga TaxID=79328 RepID=UPI001455A4CE|nr:MULTISPECIES: FkbM family methyltransferase [Chitinophaga]NLR57337.1 FkbM family methyltransferase [Chitinophaga polysaccharea]NLU92489.1 FkbM family methyltransferase [Chitinophaga sp. Ak27]